jgi:hypothetical protein
VESRKNDDNIRLTVRFVRQDGILRADWQSAPQFVLCNDSSFCEEWDWRLYPLPQGKTSALRPTPECGRPALQVSDPLISGVSVSNSASGCLMPFRLAFPRLHFMRGHSPGFGLDGGNSEAESQCQNNVAHVASILTDPEV